MTKEDRDCYTWRPLCLDDLSNFSEWFWDFKDIALFDRNLPIPTNLDAMRASWRKSLEHSNIPSAYWFIAINTDNVPAGIAGLDAVNYIHGDAVVPVFVGPRFRRNGLAKAMSLCLLDLAFKQLRLHRLTTYYRDDNTATKCTLQSLGFQEEGRFREGWFFDGQRRDVVIAGLLGSEWEEKRKSLLDSMAQSCQVTFKPSCWTSTRD